MVPFLKSASRLCCFSSLTALIFLTFLLRNANGKKTASRLCCFCMFSNNEFWLCSLSQKKRESASCERMLKLRLPRLGLDSMAPTRQKTGGGGHSPHGVFNPPAPLWGEGVLDKFKNPCALDQQGCAAFAVSQHFHRSWDPVLELNAKT